MFGIQKILVGVDVAGEPLALTATSQAAIERAIWLAERNQSSVTLLSVLDTPPVESEAIMEAAENPLGLLEQVQKLHAAVSEQSASRNVKVSSRVDHGRAWVQLIKDVVAEDFDLVIVGSREKEGQQGLFGSTALKLLKKCPCPVWVARPAAFERDHPLIIAADDLGAVGDKVLRMAVAAAQLTLSRLLVIHVLSTPAASDAETAHQKAVQEAEAKIAERLALTDYRTIEAGTRIEILSGKPEAVLEDAVQTHEASLLVMGTLERGGLAGFFVGNTAERLLPELSCSVLGIKPDEFVSSAKLE